jgi:hypothetical protein
MQAAVVEDKDGEEQMSDDSDDSQDSQGNRKRIGDKLFDDEAPTATHNDAKNQAQYLRRLTQQLSDDPEALR